ncbi:MAG TPA: restriction endonuclease subunit S, partial [Chitinophagaceae bacterium]|nr:restriction endonuclease subunit S [Chitinophagaceae bacterium]
KKNSKNFDGTIPFIKTPDMHKSSIVINTEESLSETGANYQNNKYLPPWSVQVSCIGTVGVVTMNLLKAQTNQQINSVIPKNDNYRYYSYFCLSRLKPLLEAIGGGSTMANVNKSKFESLKVLIPAEKMLSEFHQKIDPIFKQIVILLQQNQILAQARDLLLPRLMSAQIEV